MSNLPVTESQKFVGDLVWVTAAYLGVPLVGLITLPALTKSYTTAVYAVWIQSVFIVGILSLILSLYLGSAMVRFLAAEDDKMVRRRALGAMLWPVLLFSGLFFVISLLFSQELSEILFATPVYAYLVPLIILWSAVEAVFSLLICYLLARRRIKRLSTIQVSLSVFKMAVIVILALSRYELGWIIGCIVAGETILIVALFGMIISEIGWSWPTVKGLKDYLAFSTPLIPGVILFWAIGSSDRFFITYLLDLSQSGIYSASSSIGVLIAMLYGPIMVALSPVLSRLWDQGEKSKVSTYLEYSNKLFVTLAIPGAAGLYILSQPLLGILTTPAYMVGGGLVLLIAMATVLAGLYQINVYVIFLVHQTKWLLPVMTLASVANIIANLALIPVLGITGAAIAAIIAYLILSVTMMVWARRVIGCKISMQFILKVIIGSVFMAVCINFIHISGILGIITVAVAGVIIFSVWMWLTKAFSASDINLIKEIVNGLRQGSVLK